MKALDLSITSLEDILAFDIQSGAHLFTLDELQNAKIGNSEEKTDLTGKGGRKLNSLKKNKAVNVSGTNGTLSGGLMELQVGNSFQNKEDAEVQWTDPLTITGNVATTSYVAVGTAGAEITNLYIKDANGVPIQKLTQSDTATETTFTYDPATKQIAFLADTYADGTEIIVYYTRKLAGDVLENLSDVYSKKCKLYVNALAEDKCSNVYRVQIYFPRADFNGNFELDMGDNQTVHAFEAESLPNACAGGALWTYTVFGVNTADYVAG